MNGVEYLKQRPLLLMKMFELMQVSNLENKKQLIFIFIGLCKVLSGSFDRFNRTAINVARRNN